MPYLRPGLTDLRQQALTDMLTAPGASGIGVLRFAISRALSWALGYLAHGLYGFVDWVSKQSTPFTASGEYLEGWAALKGVIRKPATAWQGTARWTGGVPGTLLPSGSSVSQGSNSYTTTADAAVATDGTVTAALLATATGSASNLALGGLVTLTIGIAGIAGNGVVTAVTQPGVDLELDEAFQTRMLQVYAAPPQGGDASDYVEWAGAVPGVTRAWCKPLGMGGGTVVVYTMWDIVEAAYAGFPQGINGVASAEAGRDTVATGDQLVVANALYPLRPVTALVYSVAPVAGPVNFMLHSRTTIATGSALDLAIKAAIDGVFLAVADPLGTELQTDLFQVAIKAVSGMPDFTMTAPASAISFAVGTLPVRGTVSYA